MSIRDIFAQKHTGEKPEDEKPVSEQHVSEQHVSEQPTDEATVQMPNAAEVVAELMKLESEGRLNRAIEDYIRDEKFPELLCEYGTRAAVRICDAESGAKDAEERGKKSAIESFTRRRAMPRPMRAGSAAEPETDFSKLSRDEFERLRKRLKAGK